MALFFTMMMAAAAAGATATTTVATPERLYACGNDQVRELRIGAEGATELWRWNATYAQDLPAEYRGPLLAHIDDCKPVDGGRKLLVTSSTGATVLIERETGKVLFRAKTPQAHSAALLPGDLIAVALSKHAAGNTLELYDSRHSEKPLQTIPLPSGHGAVWDDKRTRLFALSYDLVQAFRLDQSKEGPRLVETARWTLPGRRDGHDLSPTVDGTYYVTTDDGAWLFNPDDGRFLPYEPLNPKLRVKAVSAMGSRVAWVQAEESWWAHGFTVMQPDGSHPLRLPTDKLQLYKVRWIQ